jgi:TolB-like protein/AraC-like DNA-binding protein/Tfp pilus assembly protein PilF
MNQNNTLVILPFVNSSSDKDFDFFSDGITEEIINALGKINELKVISRTSSFYFKGKDIPLKEIANKLSVKMVLEGSVRIAGNQIRISAQLIDSDNDFQVWSNTWDRELRNIFEIQDEISLLIADNLREYLGHFEIDNQLITNQTDNLEVFELALKARFLFNKWNPNDVNEAISLFEEALEADPNHVESMVGLADCYSFLSITGFMNPDIGWQKTVEYTNKGLELDPKHPGLHYILANISFFKDCNFSDSMEHAMDVVRFRPNYPEGQQFLSFLFMLSGQLNKAEEYINSALAIDPLNQETQFYKAFFLYRSGEYQSAIESLEQLLEANPNSIPAITVLAYCLLKTGTPNKAIELFDNLPEDLLIEDDKLGVSCLAYILLDNQNQVDKHLRELESKVSNPQAIQSHSYLFLVYVNLNRFDDAIKLYENTIADKSPIFMISLSDPLASNIKDDSRYQLLHNKTYKTKTNQISENKQNQPLLDEPTSLNYTNRLITYMEQETPYLNPDLSLRHLAELIEIHPNQLSWLLNTQLDMNYNYFVNKYRLSHFIELATDEANSHISLMGLAFESGFNSKTVFNTFFKKETGMTPSAYLKSKTK